MKTSLQEEGAVSAQPLGQMSNVKCRKATCFGHHMSHFLGEMSSEKGFKVILGAQEVAQQGGHMHCICQALDFFSNTTKTRLC